MNDLISRQEALKAVDVAFDTIKNTSSFRTWIPCNVRLPKREKESQMRGYYLTTNAYGSVGVTGYEFESGSFGYIGWHSDIRIIAWMPLPEPYKPHKGGVV